MGRGGFGEVWRARHRVDRKEYAVKVVPFTFNEDKDPLDHPALREAQTWASFDVPGAVRYHSSWLEIHGAKEETPKVLPTRALPAPADLAQDTNASEQAMSQRSYSFGMESFSGVYFEHSEGGETPSTATGGASRRLPRSSTNSVRPGQSPASSMLPCTCRLSWFVVVLCGIGLMPEMLHSQQQAVTLLPYPQSLMPRPPSGCSGSVWMRLHASMPSSWCTVT
eukprot:SRR837773.3095.p1 GENE.SRR837773.3095~~SRR837773.3095.p1  ORF type:complete len:244 (+),score=12.91 SRR837773.3095:64-732(+)